MSDKRFNPRKKNPNSSHDFRKMPNGKNKGLAMKKYHSNKKIYALLTSEVEEKCMICGIDENLVLDHCHKTNMVRGLLCSKCNVGLGFFEENPAFLTEAINYLKNSKTSYEYGVYPRW